MTWTSRCVVCSHLTESLCGDGGVALCSVCATTATVELHVGGRTLGVLCGGTNVWPFLGPGKFPVRVVHRIKLQELDTGGTKVTVVDEGTSMAWPS